MARNFYKSGNSYYYSDNNQKILNIPELQAAQKAGGKEIAPVETQASVDAKYAAAAANNPAISTLAKGGSSLEEIINGLSTGDISGLVNWEGKPFSVEAQQKALTQATEDNKLYYQALKDKEKTDTENSIAKSQADYQDYLINSADAFQADKTKSDQQAADSGVLFSGGRMQREKNLAKAYERDQATKQRTTANAIGTAANNFQYQYGNDEASGLSKYYDLGSNTFNPNTATGGVSSGGLSSVYNPNKYNFQGTRNVEQKTAANTRAAGLLWNKGNKLLASGYNNQY
jgi:hypothetical protein